MALPRSEFAKVSEFVQVLQQWIGMKGLNGSSDGMPPNGCSRQPMLHQCVCCNALSSFKQTGKQTGLTACSTTEDLVSMTTAKAEFISIDELRRRLKGNGL